MNFIEILVIIHLRFTFFIICFACQALYTFQEVVRFIDSLKGELAPGLNQTNKANKATVGTFFSVRNPQNAMRSFGTFISKIDWSKSESLNELFLPFMYLGEEKPNEIVSAE